jgi:hypothetical protein
VTTTRSIFGILTALLLCGTNMYAQYCMTGGPSSGTDSHISQVLLDGETSPIDYIIGCTGATGVTDMTSLSTELGVTASYSLLINFNSCGGFYEGDAEAWIDYDQDGLFELTESLGSWTGTPPQIQSLDFTVPGGAALGWTRMRVMLYEDWTSSVTPPLDPCASFTWGSVYDFSINIIPWVDCSGIMGDDMPTAIPITALPFSDSQNTTVCYTDVDPAYNSADVYYRLEGADVGDKWLDVNTCGSAFDTYLAIHDGSGNVIYYNDDASSCSPQSALTVPITEADTFFFVVQGWGSLEGDFVISINESVTSTFESNNKNEFIIYPNPTSNVLYISSVEGGLISLFDPLSKLLLKKYLNSGINVIDLSEYPEGMYILNCKQNDVIRSHKIIIQK